MPANMDAISTHATAAGSLPPPSRRADAGSVRLGERDVTGQLLCGDMYGAPYDPLAATLGVHPDRLRGIVARWRRARYVQTARQGLGPAWRWLTRPGLAVTGQPLHGYPARVRTPGAYPRGIRPHPVEALLTEKAPRYEMGPRSRGRRRYGLGTVGRAVWGRSGARGARRRSRCRR
jgi:hypothetical protein